MDVNQGAGVGETAVRAGAAAKSVLLTLASAQFLMTLDSSVMNVSIATVAADVGTTVTGIQTAITFYTLVMASLMITGGKLGEILLRSSHWSRRTSPVISARGRMGSWLQRVRSQWPPGH